MASSATEPAPASADGSPAPTRIKRNTACVRCRDAKVRCNASVNPTQRCLRCSKLDLDCVIDKGHKRTSRRSKLEELADEVRNLKQAVVVPPAAASNTIPLTFPPLRPEQLPSPYLRQQPFNPPLPPASTYLPPPSIPATTLRVPESVEPALLTPNLSHLAATAARVSGQIAAPRALASRVFSGEDIDYYFEKYFEHFHKFLPIVRTCDSDLCYRSAPLLFWAIVVTACRRYPRGERTLQFLVEAIKPEISSALAMVPLRPSVINALLILSTWPLPDMRYMTDPTYVLAGAALNAGLYLGQYTGRGNFPEFGAPKSTDEEAVYTWSACNIVSQRVSTYLGYPSIAPFSGKSLDKVLCGHNAYNMPRSFAIALHAAKFSNKLSRTVTACLEDYNGISHHLVDQAEEEWLRLKHTLHTGVPDIDDFTFRSVLLEIQILHWLPPTQGTPDEILRRNVEKCFHTATDLIRLSLQLERNFAFLSHSPHFVFRSLLGAACAIIIYLRSPYYTTPPDNDRKAANDLLIRDCLAAMRACSVMEDDLCMRAPFLMETSWSMMDNASRPQQQQLMGPTINATHRMGVGIVYDCLGRWKTEIEKVRGSAVVPKVREDAQNDGAPAESNPGNPELGMNDFLFRGMDWGTMNLDDFPLEWIQSNDYIGQP